MTQSPSEPAQLDPESQYSQLLVEFDEALAASDDVSTVASQPFVSHLADEELQSRFSRVQACLQLLDQDRRRKTATSASGRCQSPDSSSGEVQISGDSWSLLPDELTKFPRQIGRFRVIRRLGSGGFGVVFLAEDPLLRRQVAIKLPLDTIFQSPDLHARFLRECRAAAKLNHPGIVRVLESGDVQGVPFQVSEYVDGERLSDLLKRERMSVASAAMIVRGLADAVQHAHERGVLHRDLKPDNILIQMLAESGSEDSSEHPPQAQTFKANAIPLRAVPRITDFGLARVLDDDSTMSCSGMLIGTPKYMAPEQLHGDSRQQGPRTDVYSLGIVLHELLTGKVPFPKSDGLHARIAKSEMPVPSIRTTMPEISKDLETICLKCLQVRPQDRYTSAGDLRDDLTRWLEGRPTLARPLPLHEQFQRWIERNKSLGVLLGVLSLTLFFMLAQAVRNDFATRRQNEALSLTLSQVTSEKQRADEALTLATTNRRAAEASELKFRDIAWLAQQGEYSTNMIQATAFWHRGDIASMNQAILPYSTYHRTDSRGFEWQYLWEQGQTLRPLIGHTDTVWAAAITDDGEYCFSISDDNTIRRWHLRSGRSEAIWKLDGEGANVRAQFSKNRHRVLISRKLKRRRLDDVTVLDLQSGKILMRREFPIDEIGAVAISNDGKHAVVGGRHNRIDNEYLPFAQLWLLDQDQVIHDESSFRTPVVNGVGLVRHTLTGMSFTPDGNSIVIAATIAGGVNDVWRHEILKVPLLLPESPNAEPTIPFFGTLKQISLQVGRCREMKCSPDGRYLATALSNESSWAEVWDLQTDELVRSTKHFSRNIDCISFDSSGTQLGFGYLDSVESNANSVDKPVDSFRSMFKLWDFVADTTQVLPYKEHRDLRILLPLKNNVESGWLVGETGGSLNVWRPDSVSLYRELKGHHPKEAWDLAFSTDGAKLLSVGDDHSLRSWDLTSLTELQSVGSHTMLASCVATSPDGRWVATGSYDDQVVVHDSETLMVAATLNGHTHDIRAIAFSTDSRFLATAGRDKIIRIWSVPEFQPAGTRDVHENTVRALSWTTTGELFSSDSDGRILSWNASGNVVRDRTEAEGVNCMAFAPAGLRMPVRAENSAIPRAEIARETSPAPITDNSPAIVTVAADELLALGMNHGAVRLWYLPTDTVFFEAQHHGVEIRSLAFSSDGRTLAVAGTDDAIHLWHVATGRKVLSLNQLGTSVHRVMFSPDGSKLLAALHDGSIRVWDAPATH